MAGKLVTIATHQEGDRPFKAYGDLQLREASEKELT